MWFRKGKIGKNDVKFQLDSKVWEVGFIFVILEIIFEVIRKIFSELGFDVVVQVFFIKLKL